MQTLTWATIQSEYHQALAACDLLLPLTDWCHMPNGIELTRQKTKYGLARYDGMVFINHAFIGTTAINQLRKTLRHELAHLAAGLKHKHNHHFRKINRLFTADIKVSDQEHQILNDAIGFKWTLIAHCENGQQVTLGGAHRKSKRYTDYPSPYCLMTIEGLKISRFEYIANT